VEPSQRETAEPLQEEVPYLSWLLLRQEAVENHILLYACMGGSALLLPVGCYISGAAAKAKARLRAKAASLLGGGGGGWQAASGGLAAPGASAAAIVGAGGRCCLKLAAHLSFSAVIPAG